MNNRIRNRIVILLIMGLLGVGLIYSNPGTGRNWGLLVSVGLLGLWFITWRVAERKKVDPRIIALTATMAALATLTRVAFAPVASFKPTTFIVMITGYVCGPTIGFSVGALTALASNFFLGQGPWTPWQMVCWGLCGWVAGWLGNRHEGYHPRPFIILAAFCGLAFGWIMNIWNWVVFISPLTLKTFLASYVTSLPFDLLHAAGNVTFSLLLGRPFYQIINRVYSRIKSAHHKL